MALLTRRHNRIAQPGKHRVPRPYAPARRLCAFGMTILALWLAVFTPTASAQRGANIDSVKAAFTMQLTNFIDWPESTFEDDKSPFVICVIGNEAVAENLRTSAKDKTIKDRKVAIKSYATLETMDVCHVIFIDKAAQAVQKDLIDLYMDKPVLTFSDDEDFTKDGGIIRLFLKNAKPKLEINVDAVERSGLKVKLQLLELADRVHDRR